MSNKKMIACIHIVCGTVGLSHVLYVSDASYAGTQQLQMHD